ncbi:MAG: sulfatase-like hydrolase/transferase [Candidatus Theseobacter exili]|nr:sulfatase-like hydrolase/transferase [Candidatus Theseobacter exili]
MNLFKKSLFIIVLAAIACLISITFFAKKDKTRHRPNVLFIIVDTLRSDHLGCYGYDKIKTPNIDSLAEKGILFKDTLSQVPLTFPSHCSLFTSTYPQYNEVRDNGTYILDESAVTLAERLKDYGYKTAAFVSTFVLNKHLKLDQGFDVYDDDTDSKERRKKKKVVRMIEGERTASEVTQKALEWLKLNKDDRFFLWVHYYDPHTIYEPPSPYKEIYKDNLYDGEIAYTDEYIGKLLAEFKNLGLEKDTLIVFAADHGEGLGQHDESGHAVFIYDSTLKVPLIFSWPGVIPEGKTVESQVRLVDVMPTILDLLHIKKNREIQGKSLIKLIVKKIRSLNLIAYGESLYAHLRYNWSPLHSLRTEEWKYIKSPQPELYNIREDPLELVNLAEDKPGILKKMDRALEKFLKKTSAPESKETKVKMDEDTKAKLMSLGYIQGDFNKDSKEPVPRDMIKVLELINLSDRKANSGMVDEAIKGFKEVLRIDPENKEVYQHLAQCYKEKDEYELAVKYFKKAASYNPEDPMVHDGLGNVYKSMGMLEEAFEEFTLAHKLDPEDPAVINNIGWYYQQKSDYDKAMEYYDKAIEIDSEFATVYVNKAICYRKQGDYDKAKENLDIAFDLDPEIAFANAEKGALVATLGNVDEGIVYCKKAVEIDPESFDGHNNLGFCYEMNGQFREAIPQYLKAIEISPWNSLPRCNLANTYLKIRAYLKAKEQMEEALKLKPGDKEIIRVLKRISEVVNPEK